MEIIHYHFTTLRSTSDWAKQQLPHLPKDALTIVTAETQTAGRGQYGRRWHSSADNLYVSFVFFANQPVDALGSTHVLALSICNILERLSIPCQIKWPNDLMVHRKKIGGILCETSPLTGTLGIVLGLGLNVNMTKEDVARIDQPATAISLEVDQKTQPTLVLDSLKEQFHLDLTLFLQKGFEPFKSKLDKSWLTTLNQI